MDANVPVNCQNPDCSAPSASPNNSDASPDDWKAFPWHKFPGFSISERVGVRHYLEKSGNFGDSWSSSLTLAKWGITDQY
ncbi:Uncharacterized protein HZ326_23138 [Fusarium oxysporum f. sp. albedinis]|nr:Uncharacterized protein HZ326_23138 [Fusarium oxysporum f. sp. albedinis]